MLEGVILNVCCVCYVMLCNFFRNSCPSELKKKLLILLKTILKFSTLTFLKNKDFMSKHT